MNRSQFFFAKIAIAIGFKRKNKRLSEAADEGRLLRMGWEILGEDVWEQCETIGEVSTAYWTLRKLSLSKQELGDKMNDAGGVLSHKHKESKVLQREPKQPDSCHEKERDELVVESNTLMKERDQIIERASDLRMHFDASRIKMQVLAKESRNDGLIAAERLKMSAFMEEFKELKSQRAAVAERLDLIIAKIKQVEEEIKIHSNQMNREAVSVYQSVVKANREISQLSAEIGLVDAEMQRCFVEIGKFVSQNVSNDTVCREVCKKHKRLVVQLKNLRRSITFNHKLAAMEA